MPKIMTCTASGATAPFFRCRKRRRGAGLCGLGPRSSRRSTCGTSTSGLYIRYRILSRDLRTGWKRRSWTGRSLLSGRRTRIELGKICRVSGRSQRLCLRHGDAGTKSSSPTSRNGNSTNYLLLDGHAIVLCETENACNAGRSTLRTACDRALIPAARTRCRSLRIMSATGISPVC